MLDWKQQETDSVNYDIPRPRNTMQWRRGRAKGEGEEEEEVIVIAVVYLYLLMWENAHNIFLGGKASHRTEFSVLLVYKQVACAIYYAYIYAQKTNLQGNNLNP